MGIVDGVKDKVEKQKFKNEVQGLGKRLIYAQDYQVGENKYQNYHNRGVRLMDPDGRYEYAVSGSLDMVMRHPLEVSLYDKKREARGHAFSRGGLGDVVPNLRLRIEVKDGKLVAGEPLSCSPDDLEYKCSVDPALKEQVQGLEEKLEIIFNDVHTLTQRIKGWDRESATVEQAKHAKHAPEDQSYPETDPRKEEIKAAMKLNDLAPAPALDQDISMQAPAQGPDSHSPDLT